MELFIIILLLASLAFNIFMFSYVRFLLEQLSFISENINSLVRTVVGLKDHLADVYELERFYGDPTLEDLLRHSTEAVNVLADFEDIYSLVEDLEDPQETEEESPIGDAEETDDSETP
jgi:hypothetical protein